MEFPTNEILRQLVEHDPASPEFQEELRQAVQANPEQIPVPGLDLWKDVFVQQKLPWARFLQSGLIHACALALIWTISIAWLRQQKILTTAVFDRSSVITYSPEEYLPPLDTGPAEDPKPQKGDPVFAKQPILSVPREANSHSQTVVVPPDLKLEHDIPLPNIVATGAVAPIVPLSATTSLSNRTKAPDPQVVAPAPEVDFARDRVRQAGLKSEIVPPPPEVRRDRARGMAGPESAVVSPPPELTAAKGRVGDINIGASEAVAPAPQLALAEQHALYARGEGGGKDFAAGSAQPVAPPPSVPGSGGGSEAAGRLIALNAHPAALAGPVAMPAGNRRGSFEAGPQGREGAAGTPSVTGSKSGDGTGFKGHSGSLPAGLHVGDPPGAKAEIARDGAAGGNGDGEGREVASVSKGPAIAGRRSASAIPDEKVTEADRQVFGDRRPYGTTLNMPNLNSSTGSWVMHFAELQPGQRKGDLLQPLPTEKADPGYPLELIRANVHGTVTLYAVIHADGGVDGIRVLKSPDDRLNGWAVSAMAGWKFLPALRDGKPVAVEAVVEIPFQARKTF